MVSPDGHGGITRRRATGADLGAGPVRLTASLTPRPAPIKGAGVPCRGACTTLRRPGMCEYRSAKAGVTS